MKLYKKTSFLIIIALIGLSCARIGTCYEDTEYLPYGESTYYGVEMLVGDNLTWSFNTYSEEFEVQCRMSGDIYLSEGLTSDSGVWYAPDNDTYYIIFINMDTLLFRNGWINIYFEVNVEPEPEPEPNGLGYSLGYFLGLVVFLGIGVVLFIGVPVGIYRLYKKKTKERKIFITQEPKDILAQKTHYCQNCGKEIIPNTKFCRKCGHDTSI